MIHLRHRHASATRSPRSPVLLSVAAAFAVACCTASDSAEEGPSGLTAQHVERGYQPAGRDDPGPALPFAGLAAHEAERVRLSLASHDRGVADALHEADELLRASSAESRSRPFIPSLARLPTERLAPPRRDLPRLQLPVSAEHALTREDGPGAQKAAGCSGNCYQSDRVMLSDHEDDVYGSDYYVWLAIPQASETNQCDGSSGPACFWFYAMTYYTDRPGSAIHIGPQRGTSLAGSAGANWRMNIDGYDNGVHVGGQSTTNLPVATWIRVRTWRVATGNDGIPWATFGVWALWDGVDHYLGSVTIDGTWITNSNMFMEVYEQDGQCSTDLERGYLHHPTYWRGSSSFAFPQATADYEANCANSTWRVQQTPDLIADERETTRIIPQGARIW